MTPDPTPPVVPARQDEPARIVICGSLNRVADGMARVAEDYRRTGAWVHCPTRQPEIPAEVHAERHDRLIEASTLVVIVQTPDGYLGESTTHEMCAAVAAGKPIAYRTVPPDDEGLCHCVGEACVGPRELCRAWGPMTLADARVEIERMRAKAVVLPENWRERLATALQAWGSAAATFAAAEVDSWRAPTVGDTAPPATETQTGHPGNCGTCGRTLSLSTPIRTDSARYCSITCWETANPPEEMHAPSDYERENCGRCYRCLRPTFGPMGPDRMILCPYCGNKRCPNATDHHNPCTHSNEPGQPGSRYLALLGFTEVERSPAKPPEEPRDGQ